MTRRMNCRRLLKAIAALPFARVLLPTAANSAAANPPVSRVRPGDPAWPSEAAWEQLDREVGGRPSRCVRRSRPASAFRSMRTVQSSSSGSRTLTFSATRSG